MTECRAVAASLLDSTPVAAFAGSPPTSAPGRWSEWFLHLSTSTKQYVSAQTTTRARLCTTCRLQHRPSTGAFRARGARADTVEKNNFRGGWLYSALQL